MRPTAEYREPTDREWREFTDHFQLRKLELELELELGTCGTPCNHEHACLTEMILSWNASLPRR